MMFKVNKKLWSFNFGCLIAGSLVWLVQIGQLAPVPQILHPHTDFVLDYYPGTITAIVAILLSFLVLMLMRKGFELCASEHTFWLLLPTHFFVVLSLLVAPFMFTTLMFAAVPIMCIVLSCAVVFRLKNRKVLAA